MERALLCCVRSPEWDEMCSKALPLFSTFFSNLENAKNNAKCKSSEMHSKMPKKLFVFLE